MLNGYSIEIEYIKGKEVYNYITYHNWPPLEIIIIHMDQFIHWKLCQI